jgi:hypothetical protein
LRRFRKTVDEFGFDRKFHNGPHARQATLQDLGRDTGPALLFA